MSVLGYGWPVNAVIVVGVTFALWFALWALGEWLERRRTGRSRVSTAWLDRQEWAESRAGSAWEGPRWNDAKTVAKMRRQEARDLRMADRKRA